MAFYGISNTPFVAIRSKDDFIEFLKQGQKKTAFTIVADKEYNLSSIKVIESPFILDGHFVLFDGITTYTFKYDGSETEWLK